MAIGNMHKKLGEDQACGSGDILTGRQTHTQTYSSQYLHTHYRGKVIRSSTECRQLSEKQNAHHTYGHLPWVLKVPSS